MSTETATRPADQATTNPDDLDHIVCPWCYPRGHERPIAYCGHDCTDEPDNGDWRGEEDNVCVVCLDLVRTHDCTEDQKR